MRSSSLDAISVARHEWAQVCAHAEDGSLALAHDVFSVADMVKSHASVRRALTDPARTGEDRKKLCAKLFASRIDARVEASLEQLITSRWSDPDDVTSGIEILGVDAVLAHASYAHRIDKVEEELYRLVRFLGHERDVRIALGDRARELKDRLSLVDSLFSTLTIEAQVLLKRAVAATPLIPLTQSLMDYTREAAALGKHVIAAVTVAQDLNDEQLDRLRTTLSARYSSPVSVHVSVDPRVIGGMRIRVGEEVIDGTLATRLRAVREALHS